MNGEHEARRLVVDTDILIDALRDMQEAVTTLEEIEERAIISIVTQMELIVGCRNARELRRLERFLTHQVHDFHDAPLRSSSCNTAQRASQ